MSRLCFHDLQTSTDLSIVVKHNNHEVDFSKQLRGMISKLLCKMPDPEFEQASEHYVRRRTTATIDRVRSIYDIDLPGAACESLQAIFREAVQISRMVRLQSATYGAHLPKVNARVNTLWMADRYGSTIEEATDAGVSMALFPALLKCSDRMGADVSPGQCREGGQADLEYRSQRQSAPHA